MTTPEELLALLGPAVLLPIPHGEKGPKSKNWQKLRQEDMTPDFLARLNHGSNIGVLLGQPSGGLCSIDFDDDAELEVFREANPQLADTLESHGARGGNLWFRFTGVFPKSGKIKRAGKAIGEFRGTGCQTVIVGRHPCGCYYRNNGKRPADISFKSIRWPTGLNLPWKAEEPVEKAPNGRYTANDAGRAERFVDRLQNDIRYVPEREIWLNWDAGRWRIDRDGGLERLAIQLSRDLLAEAARVPGVYDAATKQRAAACIEALACGDRRNISDFLALAKVDRRILLPVAHFDDDPWLVGARNAVVELKTGTVREYSRNDYITRALGCDVDPQSNCPRWLSFIEEVFPDPALRHYVHKAVGYTLTGDTREQCFFFCYGTGRNGKSKFMEALEHVFGELATRAGKGIVATNHRGDYPLRELADVCGARFILASETEESERLNESVIKDLTGSDSLRAEHKYERAFSFKAVGKLWICGNHKPTIRGTDGGIWRRVRLVPFTEKFEGNTDDRNLSEKLRAEESGILTWMVRGCLLWQREGLEPPPAVVAAVADYRAEEDTLADFLDACTTENPDSYTTHATLFGAYRQWAESNGLRHPLTSRVLAKRLRERQWADGKNGHGARVWRGVTLVHNR